MGMTLVLVLYPIAMAVAYLIVVLVRLRGEARRRSRFPKQICIDGEVAYRIDHEGFILMMPRWELRVEPGGGLTVMRRSSANGGA